MAIARSSKTTARTDAYISDYPEWDDADSVSPHDPLSDQLRAPDSDFAFGPEVRPVALEHAPRSLLEPTPLNYRPARMINWDEDPHSGWGRPLLFTLLAAGIIAGGFSLVFFGMPWDTGTVDTAVTETAPEQVAEPRIEVLEEVRITPATEDVAAAEPVAIEPLAAAPAAPSEPAVPVEQVEPPARVIAMEPQDSPDPVMTGSIADPAAGQAETVAAEPEIELPEPVAAPEVIPEADAPPVAEPALPPEEPVEAMAAVEEPQEVAALPGAGEGVAATVTSSVNLRAGPDNGAAVVSVLTAGEKVTLLSCEHWCRVKAEGGEGFVYKSFLNGEAVAAVEGP